MNNQIHIYEPLTSENAALVLVDHQVGLMTGVRDYSTGELKHNVVALAKAAKALKLPIIVTTTARDRTMRDQRQARSTGPWTCRGPSSWVRSPRPTGSKQLYRSDKRELLPLLVLVDAEVAHFLLLGLAGGSGRSDVPRKKATLTYFVMQWMPRNQPWPSTP